MITCIVCKKETKEESLIYNYPCHKDCLVNTTDEEIRDLIREKVYGNL